MATKPSQADISRAKNYIRKRLEAQQYTEEGVERSFDKAAEEIAMIVAKYKNRGSVLRFTGSSAMAKEIQAVIDRLIRDIESYIWNNSTPEEATDEENDNIVAFLHEPYHDATFNERRDLYRKNYLKSLGDIEFDDMEIDAVEFEDAIKESSSKWVHRMLLLAATTVGLGWMKYYLEKESKRVVSGEETSAIGFWVYPGSSNPCSYCESMFGRLHPMDDPMPIYHPNCRCYIVFVF